MDLQEKLLRHLHCSKEQMMFASNLMAAGWVFVLIFATGELFQVDPQFTCFTSTNVYLRFPPPVAHLRHRRALPGRSLSLVHVLYSLQYTRTNTDANAAARQWHSCSLAEK